MRMSTKNQRCADIVDTMSERKVCNLLFFTWDYLLDTKNLIIMIKQSEHKNTFRFDTLPAVTIIIIIVWPFMWQPFVHQVVKTVVRVLDLDNVHVEMDTLETDVKHVCFCSIITLELKWQIWNG